MRFAFCASQRVWVWVWGGENFEGKEGVGVRSRLLLRSGSPFGQWRWGGAQPHRGVGVGTLLPSSLLCAGQRPQRTPALGRLWEDAPLEEQGACSARALPSPATGSAGCPQGLALRNAAPVSPAGQPGTPAEPRRAKVVAAAAGGHSVPRFPAEPAPRAATSVPPAEILCPCCPPPPPETPTRSPCAVSSPPRANQPFLGSSTPHPPQ